MSINKRISLTLRKDIDSARSRSRLRRRQRSLVRFAQCERNPDVVFLPHGLNFK